MEELVGETYPAFRDALERYDPGLGVDFVGYLSQRLYWSLEHRARHLDRILFRSPPPRCVEVSAASPAPESGLLDRLFAQEILARLQPDDAALMLAYAEGQSSGEMARSAGISAAAVRKRIERLRCQLRSRFQEADGRASDGWESGETRPVRGVPENSPDSIGRKTSR